PYTTLFRSRKMADDVPEEVKLRRLQEIVDLQRIHSALYTTKFVGTTVEVLIEKPSKKSENDWAGRNSQNLTVVFPKEHYKVGEFVNVAITSCTSGTLIGTALGHSAMNDHV